MRLGTRSGHPPETQNQFLEVSEGCEKYKKKAAKSRKYGDGLYNAAVRWSQHKGLHLTYTNTVKSSFFSRNLWSSELFQLTLALAGGGGRTVFRWECSIVYKSWMWLFIHSMLLKGQPDFLEAGACEASGPKTVSGAHWLQSLCKLRKWMKCLWMWMFSK